MVSLDSKTNLCAIWLVCHTHVDNHVYYEAWYYGQGLPREKMSYTLRVENMDSLQLLMECALVRDSSSYFVYTSDLIEIFVASGLAATVPSAYKQE